MYARPPLAMKLWLAQRFRRASDADASSAAAEHASGKTKAIESLEHIVRNRVRMFLRRPWLVTILGSIIIGGVVWTGFYFMTAPTVLRIAAGPAGSANVKVVQVLTQKFAADDDKIRLQLVATGGPTQSAQALTNDGADLAILPATVAKTPDWPVVAILRQNVMALIVPAPPGGISTKKAAPAPEKEESSASEKKEKATKRGAKAATAAKADKNDKGAKKDQTAKAAKSEDADATDESGGDTAKKLEKVTQLAGRRVGIVTGSVATRDLLDVVLKHYGVPPDKVEVSQIDPNNLAEAVKANQIDAIFVAGAATGQAITEAVAAASQNGTAPSFIAIDQADGIAKRNPAFESVDIDAGTFGGNPPSPDDSFKSLSFPEYLVARKSLGHDEISTLAKLVYSSRLALAAALPGEIKIKSPPTEKDAAILVHPGALAYLGDDQKSFFDKYGDDIFYGFLIFPIFGSAIAGLTSYFRRSSRTRRLRLLQRLLDTVRKAHAAPSLEALDQIQVDVDNLVVAIIHQTEHEDYDAAMQTSFSLALDQVRFAVAARRTTLLERGGAESKAGGKAVAA
jgi:TRAP-type uncharacterized transport system substrate-binding protein